MLAAMLFLMPLIACEPAGPVGPAGSVGAGSSEPVIEATPLQEGNGDVKIAAAETVTLTVVAPGAQQARILYRPIAASEGYLSLKTIDAPTDRASGKFSTEFKPVVDFAGDVWAEVTYPDGKKKETKPIVLAARGSEVSGATSGGVENNESVRSDRVTGGKIEKAEFKPGNANIKISVDVPAFKLTFWQDNKEVRTYNVGIGQKEFPIAIGERKATQVIYNPEWIPPDSEWVLESKKDVEPGERIEADDPRNPLGKIKIPLGDAFLIHQAAKPTDLGNLVSHGCIRMLKEDLYDLADKIIRARNLPVTEAQIEQAKRGTDRLVAKLDQPLIVDINYDTQVVEGGSLRLYPDVYDRKTSTVENLRTELQSVGVDVASLDNNVLKQMLDRVTRRESFVVSIQDLQAGRGMQAGKTEPLIAQAGQAKPAQTKTPAQKKQPASSRGR